MKKFNLKILYVEDDKQTRENYKKFFQIFFEEVLSASSGEEAIDIFKKNKPNIVLTDININEMDGLDLSKKIRSIDLYIPIIILSAFPSQKNLLKSIDLKVTKFLIKPVKIKELETTLINIAKDFEKKDIDILEFDCNIIWNKKNKLLYKDNILVKLTKLEQELLTLLSSAPYNIFKSDEILNYLWEDEFNKDYDTKALRALIYRLKTKLDCQIIESIYKIGYKLLIL